MRWMGLNLLALTALLGSGVFAVPEASAKSWCTPTKTPTINIRASTDQISYDFSLSEKQLNRFNISTVNPYGDNVITDVGGLMKGGIKTQQKMTFGTLTNRQTGQMCMWYDMVDVLIHIQPTIYIASEFPRGTCMHKAIMAHEQKHIQVDREIVNKYAALIGKALKNDIYKQAVFGPVPINQQNQLHQTIKGHMQYILQKYISDMSAERKARQQQIDSLPEYERVNHQCKK